MDPYTDALLRQAMRLSRAYSNINWEQPPLPFDIDPRSSGGWRVGPDGNLVPQFGAVPILPYDDISRPKFFGHGNNPYVGGVGITWPDLPHYDAEGKVVDPFAGLTYDQMRERMYGPDWKAKLSNFQPSANFTQSLEYIKNQGSRTMPAGRGEVPPVTSGFRFAPMSVFGNPPGSIAWSRGEGQGQGQATAPPSASAPPSDPINLFSAISEAAQPSELLSEEVLPPKVANLFGRILRNPVGTSTLGPEAGPDTPLNNSIPLGEGPPSVGKQAWEMAKNSPAFPIMMGFTPGTIAGAGAKVANKAALEWAKNLTAKGVHPQEVWQTTGWMQGPDGAWRFEIPDTNAALMESSLEVPHPGDLEQQLVWPNRGATLNSVLYHPKLFRAYPDMADMPVRMNRMQDSLAGIKGSYWEPSAGNSQEHIRMGGAPREQFLSTLLHEVQHAIQNREGFSEGGSAREFLPQGHDVFAKSFSNRMKELEGEFGSDIWRGFYDVIHNRPNSEYLAELRSKGLDVDEMRDLVDQWKLIKGSEEQAFKKYQSLAGETEARNVQKRYNLSPEELSQIPPYETADVPESEQIIKLGSKIFDDPKSRKALLEMRLRGWQLKKEPDGGLVLVPARPGAAETPMDNPDLFEKRSENLRVPPDQLSDSPRFLAPPDTGNFPVGEHQPDQTQLRLRAIIKEGNELLAKIKSGTLSRQEKDAAWGKLEANNKEFNRLFKPTADWADRQKAIRENVPGDAEVMMKAVEDRQKAGRNKFPVGEFGF